MYKHLFSLIIFSLIFWTPQTFALDLDDCDVINGISICKESNGTKIIVCNPRIHRDKQDLQACQNKIQAYNQEKRFYHKQYKKNCSHPYNKTTEYCQNLYAQYTLSIFDYLQKETDN